VAKDEQGAAAMNEDERKAAFSRKLKQIMEQRELTQSDLAAKIWGRCVNSEGKDVARGRDRISVWVSGKNFPNSEQLEKLANVLRVKVTNLTPKDEP
jgi:transcriptional regulator with XRE-family HTH domain